ncbi:SRPBCC family protein [Rhodococcus marinonascens]|uniref:SRPBCC family protein n=1 Tax=Rhodococcus marinonascens TaxID=38311 RepID=UPI001114E492
MTWSWFDLRASRPARWKVTWSIEPQGRGTRVLLTQCGFDVESPRAKMARNAMERGWRTALAKLGDILTLGIDRDWDLPASGTGNG